MQRSFEDELSITKAKLLKAELKVNSVEGSLEAKTRENAELMAICDKLILEIEQKKQ
jgi:hypothetical protein